MFLCHNRVYSGADSKNADMNKYVAYVGQVTCMLYVNGKFFSM